MGEGEDIDILSDKLNPYLNTEMTFIYTLKTICTTRLFDLLAKMTKGIL